LRYFEKSDSWEVNQIPILDVLDDWHVDAKRRGKVYDILCPNKHHNDRKKGNCNVNVEKNVYYCFACGSGGGPINLVMALEDIDFVTAKEKLARRYGLIKLERVEQTDVRPRWTGLTDEEYALFSLQNCTAMCPIGMDEHGEVIYHRERMSLRNLARESPELHDDMLIGKFLEIAIWGTANFLGMLEEGELYMMLDEEFLPSKEWKEAAHQYVHHMMSLLQKGLMNKSRFDELFEKKAAS
jgi:hypothetical protein